MNADLTQLETVRAMFVNDMVEGHFLLKILAEPVVLSRPMQLTLLFTVTLVQFMSNAFFFTSESRNVGTMRCGVWLVCNGRRYIDCIWFDF